MKKTTPEDELAKAKDIIFRILDERVQAMNAVDETIRLFDNVSKENEKLRSELAELKEHSDSNMHRLNATYNIELQLKVAKKDADTYFKQANELAKENVELKDLITKYSRAIEVKSNDCIALNEQLQKAIHNLNNCQIEKANLQKVIDNNLRKDDAEDSKRCENCGKVIYHKFEGSKVWPKVCMDCADTESKLNPAPEYSLNKCIKCGKQFKYIYNGCYTPSTCNECWSNGIGVPHD